MADQVVAKKMSIRAGHKASTSLIVSQVSEEENMARCSLPTLRRLIITLKEKLVIILKLEPEIMDAAKEEDEMKEEIKQGDLYQEKVKLAIITLQMAISDLEQGGPLASTNGNTQDQSSSGGTQASAMNNVVVTMALEPLRDCENHVATQVNRSTTTSAAAGRESERSRTPNIKLPQMVLKKFDGQLTNWATFWDIRVFCSH